MDSIDPVLRTLVFESNEPPHGSQIRELRLQLASAAAELTTITVHSEAMTVDRSSNENAGLRVQEINLVTLVAALQGALSTIRTIPPEILVEIFLICRDDAHKSHRSSTTEMRGTLWALTRVSSRWRTICLSNSSLWNVIHLTSVAPIPSSTLLNEVINRSKGLPLQVQLRIPIDLEQWYPTWELHRLISLPPSANHGNDEEPLFFSFVDATGLDSAEIYNIFGGFRDGALSLQTMYQQNMHDPLGTPFPVRSGMWVQSLPPTFPWSHITRLQVSLLLDQFVARDMLRQCANIRECTLMLFHHSEETESTQELLYRLNSLRYLHLEIGGQNLSPFFDAFSFPNLTTLAISVISPFAPLILGLPDLYHRSQFNLEQLMLTINGDQFSELIPFLRLLPSLRALTLVLDSFNEEILAAFTYEASISIPPLTLPNLQSLHLGESVIGFEDNRLTRTEGISVARMAQSISEYQGRNPAFRALEDVVIALVGDEFEESIEVILDNLQGGGIVTYVRC
ncbi:hypothetical protein B0H13DRAFT_2519898 [Mycena leptocephala]|nr:hypothetical protein B0H13DRAFT_2519898 [Mycena leptocephala]